MGAKGGDTGPSIREGLGVWIEQERDIGSGLAEDLLPELFATGLDGLTYTRLGGEALGKGRGGIVVVTLELQGRVKEVALEQPDKHIRIEHIKARGDTITAVWEGADGEWVEWQPQRTSLSIEETAFSDPLQ